jgi:hypothetical protein
MTLLAVADLKERSAYALSMHQSLENKSALVTVQGHKKIANLSPSQRA